MASYTVNDRAVQRARQAIEARQYVLDCAREAQDLLTALPDGPVKDALDMFAVLIATRTA